VLPEIYFCYIKNKSKLSLVSQEKNNYSRKYMKTQE